MRKRNRKGGSRARERARGEEEKKKKERDPPDWLLDYHIDGNKQADEAAGEAARLAQLPRGVAKGVVQATSAVKKVQARLARIVTSLPARPKEFKPQPPKQGHLTLKECCELTDHMVSETGNTLRCYACEARATKQDFKAFLLTPCSHDREPSSKPVPLSKKGHGRQCPYPPLPQTGCF